MTEIIEILCREQKVLPQGVVHRCFRRYRPPARPRMPPGAARVLCRQLRDNAGRRHNETGYLMKLRYDANSSI
jgi:hypothetical protein